MPETVLFNGVRVEVAPPLPAVEAAAPVSTVEVEPPAPRVKVRRPVPLVGVPVTSPDPSVLVAPMRGPEGPAGPEGPQGPAGSGGGAEINDATTATTTTWSSSKISSDLGTASTADRNRANHTGTQPASTVTGLASVATSGNAADLTGVLGTSQLPPLAINDVFPVASEVEMLALTAQRGDIAIRTDLSNTYILSTDSPGTLADWKEITASGDVLSVAGKTGAVVLNKTDVGLPSVDDTSDADKPVSTAQQAALDGKADDGHGHAASAVTVTPTGNIAATDVQAALAELDAEKAAVSHAHTAADIADFTEAAQDAVAAMLASGANVTLAYDDAGNALTITASGGDAELMRDTIGTALVGINGVTVTVNDGADTITLAVSGLTIAQTTGLQAALDGKAAATHDHTRSQITDAGTAIALNAPATGDAAAGEVVLGSDSRLVTPSVWLNAVNMGATHGTPSLGAIATGTYPAWFLDASVVETISGAVEIPPDWATFNADIYWAATTTQTGGAYLDGGQGWVTPGSVFVSTYVATGGTSAAPGVIGQVVSRRLITGQSRTGNVLGVRITRAAANALDTYPADAAIMGIRFTKAT